MTTGYNEYSRKMDNLRHPNRRRVLTLGALGITTAIAGCTGASETDDEASAASDTPTPHDSTEATTETDTPSESSSDSAVGQAEFEVVTVDHPDEVELNKDLQFTITVKNTGDAAGTWTETLSAKIDDGKWDRIGEISLDVPAGTTATWTSGVVSLAYQTTVYYRLEEAATEFSVQFVAATLSYGESFTSPESIAVTVEKVELQRYYEYEDYDGSVSNKRADDGKQWAFVHCHIQNTGTESAFAPLESDINIIADSRQYDREMVVDTLVNKGEPYDGGEIEAGIVRDGWIAYQIPASLSQGDFRVSWNDDNYEGSWTARWRAES